MMHLLPGKISSKWVKLGLFAIAFLGAFGAPGTVHAGVIAVDQNVPGGGNVTASPVDATVLNWTPVPLHPMICQSKGGGSGPPNPPPWPPPLGFPNQQLNNVMFMSMSNGLPMQQGDALSLPNFFGSLQFQLVTPIAGETNFLSITFTGANLQGTVGGLALDLTASQAAAGDPGPTVAFSSSFLSFSNTTSRSFDLTFGLDTPLTGPADLTTFQSVSFMGTFSADPLPQAVPEPSTLIMGAVGFLSLFGTVLRARRQRSGYPEAGERRRVIRSGIDTTG